MSRYINADALLKYKAQLYDENGVGIYAVGTGNILRMPTADVVEVVHGEWTTKFGEFPNICCVCNKQAREKTEYCPHCGARMDGEHGKKN